MRPIRKHKYRVEIMSLSDLRGLKKAKCDYWVETRQCYHTKDESKKCTARTEDGYCLSIIVDTEPYDDDPREPDL